MYYTFDIINILCHIYIYIRMRLNKSSIRWMKINTSVIIARHNEFPNFSFNYFRMNKCEKYLTFQKSM